MGGKAERNARIGRLYYKALTDAAGYPNGMAYWEEMSAQDKYHHTVTGLQFVGFLVDAGMVSAAADIGVSDRWGEGDCDELMKHFEATEADERKEFEERVKALQEHVRRCGETHGAAGDSPEES